MIIYGLVNMFYWILIFIINLIPVFSFPVSFVSALTVALETIVKFNYYLPISDVFICLGFILIFYLQFKIIKIILKFLGIDLNA